MSTGGYWRRFLEIGEYLATCEPALFPSVVTLLELLAHPDDTGESALRGVLQEALGHALPCEGAGAALTAAEIGDALVQADPSLADVPDIDGQIAGFSAAERATALIWAREHMAAMLDQAESTPTMPACIGSLYAFLLPRTVEDEPWTT